MIFVELAAIDTLMWVALTLPVIAIWVVAFWDLTRRKDLRLVGKVAWAVAIIFTAYIGIAAYAIMRPIPPPDGKVSAKTTPRASAIVGALETLVAAHAAGSVTDASFDMQKRQILGLA